MKDFYAKNPWNSYKFIKMAEQAGEDKNEAKKFLKKDVVHDQRKPVAKFIPIVSKEPGGYQMDTFINERKAGGLNFLMFININTRKARAYPIHGKGTKQVLEALNKFVMDEPSCRSIESDEDPAYLTNGVFDWMNDHEIEFSTTTDDNHNNLGIINRFMRTIRDMAVKRGMMDRNYWDKLNKNGNVSDRNYVQKTFISEEGMQELIDSYNGAFHRSIGKSPNEFSLQDELDYIQSKRTNNNPYKFKAGDKVRIVMEKNRLGKNRFTVSPKAYTIESKEGNQFNIMAKDKSVGLYPGYRIVKAKGKVPYAKTLKGGKRGAVEEILEYDATKKKYTVRYEGGVEEEIPPSHLREGDPARVSRMEREYWVRKSKCQSDKIPNNIKKGWF